MTGAAESHEAKYIPYPKNPIIVQIGGHRVPEYVSPEETHKHILTLSEKIKFNDFEAALVNLQGGYWLFNELLKIKGRINIPLRMIEYHRPQGGFGANITVPIPEEFRGRKCLVIDDIKDTAGVLREIMFGLSPNSLAAVVVDKKIKKMHVPNVIAAMELEEKWLGGCGMNPGIGDDEQIFRDYGGIIVKPTSSLF